MDKVQFDSFHKFLVSIGIALLISPLLLYYVLICDNYGLVMTQQEYDALSAVSRQFITLKSNVIFVSFDNFFVLMIVCAVLGIFTIAMGCINWRRSQKHIDLKMENDAKKTERED